VRYATIEVLKKESRFELAMELFTVGRSQEKKDIKVVGGGGDHTSSLETIPQI